MFLFGERYLSIALIMSCMLSPGTELCVILECVAFVQLGVYSHVVGSVFVCINGCWCSSFSDSVRFPDRRWIQG